MGNNARKGAVWERWSCVELSKWWTQDLAKPRDDIFWRTSGSGARATSRRKQQQATANSCGDVMALDPIGKPLLDVVTIELKRGRSSYTIQDLLDAPSWAAEQMYAKWIAKAEADAKAAGTPYWLLIVRRDKRLPLVLFPNGLWDLVDAACDDGNTLNWFGSSGKWMMMTLADFLDRVRPDSVRRLAKVLGKCSNG